MSTDLNAMTNNRDRAIHLINEGGQTKESLMEALGINDKSLASLFSQLRLMGQYNLKNEDGTFRLGSAEEYEAARAPKGTKKETIAKTPEEAVALATKRETRAASASTTAKKRYEADTSRKNELKMIMADCELELSSILLGEAEERLKNVSVDPSIHPAEPTVSDEDDFINVD